MTTTTPDLEVVIASLRKEEYRRHGVYDVARKGSYGVCDCYLAQAILDLEEIRRHKPSEKKA